MKFDRQLWPAIETSWVVSYGGKTIPTISTSTSTSTIKIVLQSCMPRTATINSVKVLH